MCLSVNICSAQECFGLKPACSSCSLPSTISRIQFSIIWQYTFPGIDNSVMPVQLSHSVKFPFLGIQTTTLLDVGSPELKLMEKFVITMYDKSSAATSVNEARRELFTKKSCTFNHLPPTEEALLQHVRHTIYQASILVEL